MKKLASGLYPKVAFFHKQERHLKTHSLGQLWFGPYSKTGRKSFLCMNLAVDPPAFREGFVKGMGSQDVRKPRFLCLHGFRTSGEILKKQVGKWPESVLEKMDLVFVDGTVPAEGKSDVEGVFDPPYYEWYQFNGETMIYRNLDGCFAYIEDLMIKHAPIDGLLGFSQGAFLSAALWGLQAKGLALTKVPKIKFLIIIGGGMMRSPALAEKAYSCPIECPSLHFIGEKDFLKQTGTKLLESFVNPFVIHHPQGHTVPRLDEKGLDIMFSFLERIQKEMSCNESTKQVYLD